jgi:hypothetical protein
MTLNNTNINALSEKLYECDLEVEMKHIGFYLDGLNLTVVGKKDGMNCIPIASLKLTLNNNGNLETVAKMEIGNE